MNIGKAHQRIIREQKAQGSVEDLFGTPVADIKTAECREINYEQAKSIILEYEWLGTMGTTQLHYGIFFDGILGGAICFGYFQALRAGNGKHPYLTYVGEKHAKNGIQLSRGACVHWAHEHSGSKLIGYGLRQMAQKGYKYCIAFSDDEAGEIGTLYQATNWLYLGKQKENKHHFNIVHQDGKTFCDCRDLKRKLGFSNINAAEEYIKDKPNLKIKKLKRKARYIKLLGTKRENAEMMEFLSGKILPYPKRNNQENHT
jgi:hypothetical protein